MYDRTKKTKKKSEQVIINGKAWDKESVKNLLKRDDRAVCRAILRIYSFQTDEEKYYETTKTENGMGFNRFDAEILSSYAEQLKKGRELTEKQMYVARPKIMKYTGQLLKYMKSKVENQ